LRYVPICGKMTPEMVQNPDVQIGEALILAVDHAQITVPKGAEKEARRFYCDFLGLTEVEKPENRKSKGGFWLDRNGFQVHVGIEDGVDRLKTRAHLAYRVNNLEAWRRKLQEEGVEIADSLPFPRARAFEFRDPFGNRVELIQYFDREPERHE
jgi:catechol 2,3-dioxygenase-like lactoylglutathione lyase family enzyme